jgi:hypothetical protein
VPSLLAQVVRATATTTDGDVVLDRVAAVLARSADWALADRLDDPDLVSRVAGYDRDGRMALPAWMGGASARRSSAAVVGLLPALLRSPRRMLRLRADDLAALAESGEPHLARQAQTALALGAADLVILGLVARDAVLGVLTVARRDAFTDDEVAELADVATHVGTALDAGRLLALQREVATALQTSLLPPMPAVAGLALAARYVPAARGLDVGGDWYDAFPTSSGVAVVVGDVRGHDLAAAARMADLRNLLRAHVVDRDEPPAALLARLERTAEALGIESSATCVVGRLVRTDGSVDGGVDGRGGCSGDGGWRLLWANAGHLPPVLLHEGRAVLLEPEPDLMLGVESGTARADHEQPLAAGDVLVLCTDGLVERRDSTLDARLEQLRALVEEHGDAPPDLVAERLLAELAAGSTDDVALLVVQVAAG